MAFKNAIFGIVLLIGHFKNQDGLEIFLFNYLTPCFTFFSLTFVVCVKQ